MSEIPRPSKFRRQNFQPGDTTEICSQNTLVACFQCFLGLSIGVREEGSDLESQTSFLKQPVQHTRMCPWIYQPARTRLANRHFRCMPLLMTSCMER